MNVGKKVVALLVVWHLVVIDLIAAPGSFGITADGTAVHWLAISLVVSTALLATARPLFGVAQDELVASDAKPQ